MVWVAFNVSIKHRCTERAFKLIAFELGHVDAIGRKTAQCFVKRRRNIAHFKNEAGHYRTVIGARIHRLASHFQKARGVVVRVLDVSLEDHQPIKLGSKRRGDNAFIHMAGLSKAARRASRIASHFRAHAGCV